MRPKIDLIVVTAVILCAAILVGEVLTYSSVHHYDVDAEWGEGSVDYRVSSSGGDVYDAVLIGNARPVDKLMLYVDDRYDSTYRQALELSDPPYLSQKEFAEQTKAFLGFRSFKTAEICRDEGLIDFIEGTMADPVGKAVLVSSYALPAGIYDGTADCPLMKWVGNGGMLYWAGSEIGRFYRDDAGLHTVEGNQELFFGTSGCVNIAGSTIATEKIGNGFADAFCLKNSNVMNGVDVGKVSGALGMGYSENGYSSIAMVPMGSGMVCVFAGPFDINQFDDIGQVVASGVAFDSTIMEHERGDVKRGEVSSGFVFDAASDPTLYVYIGGTYTKFAEAFHA